MKRAIPAATSAAELTAAGRAVMTNLDRHLEFPGTTAMLISIGLLDFRRRWWLFGKKEVVRTHRGRLVHLHLLDSEAQL